jgi:hypothetical protein
VFYFFVNIDITVPDKEGKMEMDTLEIDPRHLRTCNQKTKVFGPVMLPLLEQKPETISQMEVTKPQCDDEEKEQEGKKNRNERRIRQRKKKVFCGSIVLFLLIQYIKSSLSHSTPVKHCQLLLI